MLGAFLLVLEVLGKFGTLLMVLEVLRLPLVTVVLGEPPLVVLVLVALWFKLEQLQLIALVLVALWVSLGEPLLVALVLVALWISPALDALGGVCYGHNDHNNKVNNNDDHSLLNVLLEHNKAFKIDSHHDKQHQQPKPQQYQLIVNNEQINQIKNQIQSSIFIISVKNKYIFTTDKNNKISIINITYRNNIHFEQQDIDIKINNSFTAYNSLVKAGNFIYIFGGANKKHNEFLKYSINTETVATNEMEGVDPCQYVSACYDGKDHIYLFDGNYKPKTDIYRYNIGNSTFERYATIEINTNYHQLSFFFKGYIYTFTGATRKIFRFNIERKTTIELSIDIPQYTSSRAACTDGNGNIYILSDLGLQRINIETQEIKLIDKTKINFNNNHNLIYHQSDSGQTYIYSIQGKDRNFIYSLENNKWESILQNDKSDRINCSNIFY
ncbi:hypothetical protein PPL_09883 [Heterostelium album PN500]|uniref:Uncharacterized protein n=1 Tax=Heterostelium pallidum (strain ATCC 26659 / Pp 5 / PN500) TaxID=670386 RepID=D3BPB8_HETP5|nr:hypothetical protein PPL_09883 [Heterostelium album PN500]EFA77128.1 hypothetical protein PPL_09883 [Heterostelium album PN500]|eukprot:XP_020429257.1 hypothetical protein PPL_09883 [Heterostelium album PN500]